MRAIVIGACCALVVAPHARAQQATIMGPGAQTCGIFAQQYQKNPEGIEVQYFAWAQGWMSGANSVLALLDRTLRDLDSKPIPTQQAQIRQYCDAHPLASYAEAVSELYISLLASSNKGKK